MKYDPKKTYVPIDLNSLSVGEQFILKSTKQPRWSISVGREKTCYSGNTLQLAIKAMKTERY